MASSTSKPTVATTTVLQPSEVVPEGVQHPSNVAADLETILQERDACGVRAVFG